MCSNTTGRRKSGDTNLRRSFRSVLCLTILDNMGFALFSRMRTRENPSSLSLFRFFNRFLFPQVKNNGKPIYSEKCRARPCRQPTHIRHSERAGPHRHHWPCGRYWLQHGFQNRQVSRCNVPNHLSLFCTSLQRRPFWTQPTSHFEPH